jgi:predicted RNase H-like HicB family nuclease
MTSHVVKLQVTASIPIDCDFWSEDDGWKGLCKSPSVTVRGSSFEDAKKNMAAELQAHIERILREEVRGELLESGAQHFWNFLQHILVGTWLCSAPED